MMRKPSAVEPPRIDELKPVRDVHSELKDLFPSPASLEWALRQHKGDYVAGGALYLIAGRLLVHPLAFRRVSMEIGKRTLAARHKPAPPPG